jgi:hypothetical protein
MPRGVLTRFWMLPHRNSDLTVFSFCVQHKQLRGVLDQEQEGKGERAAMPRRETQQVGETSGPNAQISRGGIGAWLHWLNAILEVAYSTADVETGC